MYFAHTACNMKSMSCDVRIDSNIYGRWMPAKLPQAFITFHSWTPEQVEDYETVMHARALKMHETAADFLETNQRILSYPLHGDDVRLYFDACQDRSNGRPCIGLDMDFHVCSDIFLPDIEDQREILMILDNMGLPAKPNVVLMYATCISEAFCKCKTRVTSA